MGNDDNDEATRGFFAEASKEAAAATFHGAEEIAREAKVRK